MPCGGAHHFLLTLSQIPIHLTQLQEFLPTVVTKSVILADMAGVDQLAGLVARLEAVAIKLESSGGAGGAGGDAGASVQV